MRQGMSSNLAPNKAKSAHILTYGLKREQDVRLDEQVSKTWHLPQSSSFRMYTKYDRPQHLIYSGKMINTGRAYEIPVTTPDSIV